MPSLEDNSNGLKMLSLSDQSISAVINSDMTNVHYVASFGDKLYYSNVDTHTVTCCDLHGTTQWEIKDEHVLQHPRGISVDNDGNVYVVCSPHPWR
jgi:DNA-binding beta-propeller fold protein YncE